MTQTKPIDSVCVYCGSSNATDPDYIAAAAQFGAILAAANLRLVYGGGGIGLMGACAKAANDGGGKVLGVMPGFLRLRELIFDEVETIVVQSMHERKQIMFDESDAFVILPGGIGTLEEVVELMSWRRLALHSKPLVFVNLKGYWEPFFALMEHTIQQKLTPESFRSAWTSVDRVEDILGAINTMHSEDAVPFMPMVT